MADCLGIGPGSVWRVCIIQHRSYGKTGLKVSALGFGAMRRPFYGGDRDKPGDEELASACLHRYLELGGNLIDTARAYGDSERRVGEVLRSRREQVILSTKNASLAPLRYRPGYVFTPDLWQQHLEQSFEALGVDYIDLYHVHDLSWEQYTGHFAQPGGPLDLVQRHLDDGSIRHLCFSCHDTPENLIQLIDEGVFSGMLVQYNLLDRHNEEALAHAHERGLGVNIMGPVAGGRLASPSERLTGMLENVKSVPDIALRFVLSSPHVSCALSGMNDLQMVEENCATASREEPLTPEEHELVVKTLEDCQRLLGLYCTGCGYCLPCPQGVAIPDVLAALNLERVWGLTDSARRAYRRLSAGDKPRDASLCVECGECEGKCPQKLPIMEQLREAHSLLSVE